MKSGELGLLNSKMGDGGTNPWPEIYANRRAVWYRGLRRATTARSLQRDRINSKILFAFNNVKSLPLNHIMIQFWSPLIATEGRTISLVLTCSDNPYALSDVNHRLSKYRSTCVMYYYSLDGRGDARTIISAPTYTAIRDHFPEVILDLRVHKGTPLVDLALESELSCCMMLPVFETACIGVIEVSARRPPDLAIIFNDLNRELKAMGFSLTPPQSLCLAVKAVTGDSDSALKEIKSAVSLAVQSHGITLCNVWYPYESRCDGKWKSRKLLCKLASSGVDNHPSFIKTFYDNFHVFPFGTGEGLVGKTLETHLPHMCRNIYKLSDNRRGALALLSANIKSSACFVVCLRSSLTGDLEYAFEFFWPQSRDHLALMKDLLLTLRVNLPSFKHASGTQLDDELLVDVVDSSSPGSGGIKDNQQIKIFPGNRTPEVTGPVCKKRKITDLHDVVGPSNQSPFPIVNEQDDEDADLVMIAVYKVDSRLFFLPSSATFKDVMDKIQQEFEHELNPVGTYKVNYQVLPGMWHSLTDDTSLKSCISSYQTSRNIEYVKLYVLPVEE